MPDIIHDSEEKMKKSVEILRKNFGGVRTGRASPALLDPITVEYYGAQVPLKQVASISIPEPKAIVIQAYDKSSVQAIEKAILKSQLGITPKTDGGRIILSLPPLTEERRRELVKLVKKEAEDAKVILRNIRRDAIEHLKKEKEEKKISEDQEKDKEVEVQKLIDKHIIEIEGFLRVKEAEIMEV